jgi:O-antigen/teichoic acid export membrane protein
MQNNSFQQRSKAFQITRNLSSLTVGKTAGDLFTFLFFVVLSRVFGQEGVGHYSFAIALTGFLVVFADFGLYDYSVKEMSRRDRSATEYYGGVFLLRLILSLIVLTTLAILFPFLPFSTEAKLVIVLIGAYQIVYTLVDILAAVFVAHEDMHLAGVLEFTLRMFIALTGIGIAVMGGSLVTTMAAFPIVTSLYVIVTFTVVSKKYGSPQLKITWPFFSQTLQKAMPYAIFIGLHQLSTRIDIVFLGFLLGTVASGIFNAAYRIIFFFLIVSYFTGLALLPMAARLYLVSRSELEKLYNQSLNWVILAVVPLTGGIWLIAPKLVNLIYGENFAESALILRYLTLLVFIAFIKNVMGVFLTACDRQVDRTKGQGIAACTNVLGNALLIPIIGIKGAAITSVISESFILIVYTIRLRSLFGWPRIGLRLGISCLATTTFLLTMTLLGTIPLIVEIVLSVCLYFGILLLFKDIRQNELQYLIKALKSIDKKAREGLKRENTQ